MISREWWICKTSIGNLIDGPVTSGDGVDVIEKSAYDQVCAERAILQDQLDHCSKAYQDLGGIWNDAEKDKKVLIEALEELASMNGFSEIMRLYATHALAKIGVKE